MRVHPFGITAPLGINIPDNIDPTTIDFDDPELDWSFLEDSGTLLECFGGNHVLETTQELYEEFKGKNDHFYARLCTVYHGLTDDEIIRVS